jgi:hypothetical protein
MGVSLGRSHSKVSKSVKLIQDTKFDRHITMLHKNTNVVEDDPQVLFVSKVSGLCEDLTEEEMRC